MAKIIPYNKKIEDTFGAYVSPNGTIIIVDIDHEEYAKYLVYKTNFLNGEEFKLLKLWINTNRFSEYLFSDFMVYVLGYDKIITKGRKSIVTTSSFPYEKYYNYALLDYVIDTQVPKKYDEESNTFVPNSTDYYVLMFTKDKDIEEEIKLVKKMARGKNISDYFK